MKGATEIVIRQRLMQLEEGIAPSEMHPGFIRDPTAENRPVMIPAPGMIEDPPRMTPRKMKSVLSNLQKSYADLMWMMSLIHTGRYTVERLPEKFGYKDFKIATAESRKIEVWLRKNSINLGFNFEKYM